MTMRIVALWAGLVLGAASQADSFDFAGRQATIERAGVADAPAAYNFTVRDPDGTLRRRRVLEIAGQPRVRTNDLYLDGVYAMALEEAAGNSVESIEDGQFDRGAPMPCHCFKTGVKWPYVWTRDTSYSSDLGAGLYDPVRARNSLAFKHSDLDPALLATGRTNERSVAQDTGSGGSWPISSDRVVWIHAASHLVPLLDSHDGQAWEDDVYRTAIDTLAQERRHVFDAASGLYRGETSFLDWREQTYPHWTRDDTLAIASSYSLSTNVLHYLALRDTAALAARRGDTRATELQAQAGALGSAILQHFKSPSTPLYVSYLFHDLAPIEAYDLLGLALLTESGLLDDASAQRLLSAYPMSEGGPPVIWPEQASEAIYHNRAIWPFVTAYALRAAERVHDSAHAIAYARSLIRGAALALSNQENAEFLTLSPHFEDGARSGPVINSESQLWSVAAALDLVVRDIFGVTVAMDGVHVAPSFPALVTGHLPEIGSVWTLTGLALGGGRTTVTLRFPAHLSAQDWLDAGRVTVDGRVLDRGAVLDLKTPPDQIDVDLIAHPAPHTSIDLVQVTNPKALTVAERARLYATPPPAIDAIADNNGQIRVAVSGLDEGFSWELWRDGTKVSTGHGAIAHDHLNRNHGTVCYSVRQQHLPGHQSLPSKERCLTATEGVIEISAGDVSLQTQGPARRALDPTRLALWGDHESSLTLPITIRVGGRQRFTVEYRNDGRINTGITASIKAVTVACGSTERTGTLVMPQLGDPVRRGRSTPIEFDAPAGANCQIKLEDGLNMSYLALFRHYTAGRGGSEGPENTADLLSFRVEPLEHAQQPNR